MDRDTQTSFIPRTAFTKNLVVSPRVVGLPTVVSVLALLISLTFWGGTYAYRRILVSTIESPCVERAAGGRSCGLRESVNRSRQDLDQTTTVYLTRLNDKLAIGAGLVRQHQSAVPVLRMLEELTLPSIYYSRFDYSGGTLNIEGRASSYEDIALQTQVFVRDKGRIKSFIFSDLDLDSLGNVIFKLVVSLEPEVTSYARALATNPNQP